MKLNSENKILIYLFFVCDLSTLIFKFTCHNSAKHHRIWILLADTEQSANLDKWCDLACDKQSKYIELEWKYISWLERTFFRQIPRCIVKLVLFLSLWERHSCRTVCTISCEKMHSICWGWNWYWIIYKFSVDCFILWIVWSIYYYEGYDFHIC